MAKDTSSPAFPSEQGTTPEGTWNQTYSPGMTLRQWYAGMALPSVIMRCSGDTRREGESTEEMFARIAFANADAMLAQEAREAGGRG